MHIKYKHKLNMLTPGGKMIKAIKAISLDQKFDAGYNKKSFVLNYNNLTLWAEHLDSLGDNKPKVIEKFKKDVETLDQVMMPSLVALNLDETKVDQEILTMIFDAYSNLKYPIRKLVIVGLSKSDQKLAKKIVKNNPKISFLIGYVNDYEKAKEWLI